MNDYRSVLNAHMLPSFGPSRIETVDAEGIERWRNHLAKDDKRARHTVNKIVTNDTRSSSMPSTHRGLIANHAPSAACAAASCSRCAGKTSTSSNHRSAPSTLTREMLNVPETSAGGGIDGDAQAHGRA